MPSNRKQNIDSRTASKAQTEHEKTRISLPKIDTYCISQVRPTTGHGFKYMTSTSDLLQVGSKITEKCQQTKKKPLTKVAWGNTSVLNDLSTVKSRELYLLFRAPSRAMALKENAFTVRTKPKRTRQCERKELQTCNVITNIVKLPDINESNQK